VVTWWSGFQPDQNPACVRATEFHPQFSPAAAQSNPSAPTIDSDSEKMAVMVSALSETEVTNWLAKLTDAELNGNTGRLLLRRWLASFPDSLLCDQAGQILGQLAKP
jgi:hypothetical protein